MAVVERIIERKDGKKSVYIYIEIPLPNGRKLKRSVGKKGLITKTQARLYEQELKRKIKMGQLDMVKADIPTLNEFRIDYLEYVKDVKQKRSWRRDQELLEPLCKLFGNKKLSDITIRGIEDFKLIRLQEVKPATVNRSLSVLRHLFNIAKRWKKFFGENPVSQAGLLEENNKLERILTIEEQRKLLEEAIPYIKPIIQTALLTGLRKGELFNLKWSDVDLNTNLITITQTNSKSKKQRKIYINSILRKLLLELKIKSANSEYVFLDDNGKRLNSIRTAFEAACRRAGIKGLRFHDLRHTAATRMIETGANIVAVSRILGHSDLKTTMRYTHPEESVKDALENLANFGETTTNITTNEHEVN